MLSSSVSKSVFLVTPKLWPTTHISATRSCGAGLSPPELRQALASGTSLFILPFGAWIRALVVAVQQQDDLVAVRVTKDAQQWAPLFSALLLGLFANQPQYLRSILIQSELEQPFP